MMLYFQSLFFVAIILVVVKFFRLRAETKPWLEVPTIKDVSIKELKAAGIKGIIFDVDKTLTPYGGKMCPVILHKFLELKAQFAVSIFSNASWRKKRWNELLLEFKGGPIVHPKFRKPGVGGFEQACKLMHLHPSEVAVIGDRLLTDILGGNRAGIKTILIMNPVGGVWNPIWYPAHRLLDNLLR
jgi:HAD superfamily phosphatase (TIGR01668 family)